MNHIFLVRDVKTRLHLNVVYLAGHLERYYLAFVLELLQHGLVVGSHDGVAVLPQVYPRHAAVVELEE